MGSRRRIPRRVFGVIGGIVRYGKGGDSHFMCTPEAFKRWMRRVDATRSEANAKDA